MPRWGSRIHRDLCQRVLRARRARGTQTKRSSGNAGVAFAFLDDDAALEVAGGGGVVGVTRGAEHTAFADAAVADLYRRAGAADAPEAVVAAQLDPVTNALSF